MLRANSLNKEIWENVSSMHNGKSSSLDGFKNKFFKTLNNNISNSFIQLVSDFFDKEVYDPIFGMVCLAHAPTGSRFTRQA